MASNPYVNKVQKADGTTIMDITATTAVASDVLQGKYFFTASGQLTLGTNAGGSGDGYVWQDGNGYVHLSDEEGTQPIYDTLNVNASGTFTPSQGHAYNSVVVPSGTAGTPSASKGTVTNHAVTVTPSVTNQTGWITGSTKTGTGVSVSASELVSGTKSITENGTGIDVSNYASVDVAVSGGGATLITKNITANGTYNASSDNADGYSSVTVNVSGGISGIAKGSLTVSTTVSTSTKVTITNTTEIGFVPTKFVLIKDTDSGTNKAIYWATYANYGTLLARSRAVYSSQNASLSGSFNYMDWSTSSAGYMYYDNTNSNIQISTSSSYILEADTYTWVAIQ